MASFLKKAVGLFVEFDDKTATDSNIDSGTLLNNQSPTSFSTGRVLVADELEKFEKYFEQLFEKANLPGPDYFEFWKMMETLEPHVPDENARIAATFSALSVQGLTKQTLVETANKYLVVIQNDKTNFEKALSEKSKVEVDQRKQQLQENETLINKNYEEIQNLTRQIAQAQEQISKLKGEIQEEEGKMQRNGSGYNIACDAMMKKISSDINKIQNTLK
jgi:chromosome segregation ATPase